MPTPGERRALQFLAGIALLGAGVRLVGADADQRELPVEDLKALDRQLAAADSAASAKRVEKAGKEGRKSPRGEGRAGRATRAATPPAFPLPPAPIDLDRADAPQIETLPGIGPALAARIVAWRDSAGGLGALEALDCVPGVGPTLIARVAPHVTFSGRRRPPCVALRPRPGPVRRGRS